MDNVSPQHYLEAIETLMCQWDDVCVQTTHPSLRRERQRLPVLRIPALSDDMLSRRAPVSCIQLQTDLQHMVTAHTMVLYAEWVDHAEFDANCREYDEAVTLVYAELVRVHDRIDSPL